MIVKTLRSQMGSPAAAKGEKRWWEGGGGRVEREVKCKQGRCWRRRRQKRDRTDIGVPVDNGGIRAYIGFLVETVKVRGGTTSRGTQRGAVIWCLTLHRQVGTTARRQRGRSRVNRTGNDACGHARNQRRIATPPPTAPVLWQREIKCLLYDSHQKGKMMIMIF